MHSHAAHGCMLLSLSRLLQAEIHTGVTSYNQSSVETTDATLNDTTTPDDISGMALLTRLP